MFSRRLQVTAFNCCRRHLSSEHAAVTSPLYYLHGQRMEPKGGDSLLVCNPATSKRLAETTHAGAHEVQRAVQDAVKAQQQWGLTPGMERGRILRRAADLIRHHVDTIARVEVTDTGKPLWEAHADVVGCADTLAYFGGLAPTLSGSVIPLASGSFGYTLREPLGVCGGIGAWNYPFQMAAFKSAPALACGNSMVFKPSPLTPLTTVLMAEIYSEAGLPPGTFNVIQGGAEAGQLLSTHPDIAKVSFTGSVPSGAKVMEACAQGIKYVTLELGGKSALIIFEDCDIDNAVKGAMLANFLNQGQVCSNASRVFVHRSIVDEFVDKLIARTKQMKIGDPHDFDTTVGAMISEPQAQRVLGFTERASKEGCTVAYGGGRVDMPYPFDHGYFLRPCILTDVQDYMEVAREEVFGSVLCVLPFDDEEEAIKRANNTEYGLAGGLFTRDVTRAHRVASRLQAGAVYINNYNYYPPELPFGGFKKSGLGHENGMDTLNLYTQVKSVYMEMNDVDSGPL